MHAWVQLYGPHADSNTPQFLIDHHSIGALFIPACIGVVQARVEKKLAAVDAWHGNTKKGAGTCAHGANECGFCTARKISCRAQKAKTFVDAAAATRWVGAGLDARINI